MLPIILHTFIGLFTVLFIDIVGAIASRKLKFEFGYLSFLSFLVYILIGYFVSAAYGLNLAILVALFVGFIDATLGWQLTKIFKANTGFSDEELKKMTTTMNLKVMLFVAPLFAFIGYLFV